MVLIASTSVAIADGAGRSAAVRAPNAASIAFFGTPDFAIGATSIAETKLRSRLTREKTG
jgi:hypothetical protein